MESIPEELIIFLTQQNNFEIYTYGDVPIAQTPEEGKFSFESNAVKSFTVLDNPVFQSLPLLKIYQLQLVEQVLRAQGIGVFPIRPLIIGMVALGLLWFMYSYYQAHKEVIKPIIVQVDPYQDFYLALQTPSPADELNGVADGIKFLLTIPGWRPKVVVYSNGTLTAALDSKGAKTSILYDWAEQNGATISVTPEGIFANVKQHFTPRSRPTAIYKINRVIADLVDNISTVFPGNHITLGVFDKKEVYTTVPVTIQIDMASVALLPLISEQIKDLPLVLSNVNLNYEEGTINGTIVLKALGN